MGKREKERSLVHSSNVCNIQKWARLKPEARSFSWVSCMVAGIQACGPSSIAFLRPLAESLIGNGAAVTQTNVHMGCWSYREKLNWLYQSQEYHFRSDFCIGLSILCISFKTTSSKQTFQAPRH